ncbi:serine/threonine-protein kinase [Bacillus sp. FSL H8-0547]
MMNNTSMNQTCNLLPGTVVEGKWHHNKYRIVKPLGQGATGIVYLAEGRSGLAALKVSGNSMSITSEVNVLKHFSKVRGSSLGPALVDVDDWIHPRTGEQVPFYVMEYISGKQYLDFISNQGLEWIGVLTVQLLSNLEELHRAGWVFGDLKPENLMVAERPVKLRFIDVGGTTLNGRSIKEFTDFFDRGYWGLGTRRAEPSYDLFAAAMIVINSVHPKRFKKQDEGGRQLMEVIQDHPYLRKHSAVLKKALLGKYHYAADMKKDFLTSLYEQGSAPQKQQKSRVQTGQAQAAKPSQVHGRQSRTSKQAKAVRPGPSGNAASQGPVRVKAKKKSRTGGWVETVMILAALCIIYSFYVYHYLM